MLREARKALPRALAVIERGIAAGLHSGAQLYVSRDGEPVADVGVGEARPGVPMTRDTIMLWLSCTKPVAAVAIGQLWEAGELELDDRVSAYIPAFAAGGKETVTLRHLLTHTGGFRFAESAWREARWGEIIAHICAAPLEPGWVPGKKAGYHLASSWFILGELVRVIDGRPFERYVREDIFGPLGMRDSWVGMPAEQYRAYGERMGMMYITEGGTPQQHPTWSSEAGVTLPRPGGNGHGPMRELGCFYEALLGHGERAGVRILSPQTVEALTARHRTGMMDETFGHVMDWGLGFIIDSNVYGAETVPYGYGLHSSPRTFGHSGYQSSAAFADPEHGLVVAVVCNGTPGEEQHQQRARALHTAIYEDLGLT